MRRNCIKMHKFTEKKIINQLRNRVNSLYLVTFTSFLSLRLIDFVKLKNILVGKQACDMPHDKRLP